MSENLSHLRNALLFFGGLTIVSTFFLIGDEENGGVIETAAASWQTTDAGTNDDSDGRPVKHSDGQNNRSNSYQGDSDSGSSDDFGEPTDVFSEEDSLGESAEGFDPSPLIDDSDFGESESELLEGDEISTEEDSIESSADGEMVY